MITIPRFALPSLIARIGGRLPQWPHAVALAAAFNAAIGMKLLSGEGLAPLEGRSFLIEVTDAGSRAAVVFRGSGFRPLFSLPDTPDLAFRASLSTFLQIITRQEDPDTLFFNRALSIEGDTELGLIVKNMLDAVEWPGFLETALFRR